jgi:hypothetical protein
MLACEALTGRRETAEIRGRIDCGTWKDFPPHSMMYEILGMEAMKPGIDILR